MCFAGVSLLSLAVSEIGHFIDLNPSKYKKIEKVAGEVFRNLGAMITLAIAGWSFGGPVGLGIGIAIGCALAITPIVHHCINSPLTKQANKIARFVAVVFGPATAIGMSIAPFLPFYLLPLPTGVWLAVGGVYNLVMDAMRKAMYDRVQCVLKNITRCS